MEAVKLRAMTLDELTELAFEVGVDGYDKKSFDELVKELVTYPNKPIPEEYIDALQQDATVAFRDASLKVRSAKVVRRSSSEKKLLLETAYGKQFLVDFKDVVWIKTTTRWPRWVFNLLKGSDNGSKAES